jgi:hypothetical protein
MSRLAPIALALALAASGCGYRIANHADVLPKNVKTIAIPAFGNTTVRNDLARLLPADIAHEFISRTRYAVVADPNQADAVLNGVVANFFAFPTTSDPVSGRATGAQVIVILNLTLTDRQTGKVLYSRPGAEFRERYEISVDPKAYFDESSTAVQRVSRDVARTVVSGILEAF